MTSLKQIFPLLLLIGFVSNAHALRVSELFVNGTLKNFEDIGFKNPGAVKGKLDLMFKDVFPQGEVTANQLERMVSDLAKEDDFFKELDKALKVDASSVEFKDIEQAYIHSVMLTHLKGKNLVCNDVCNLSNTEAADKILVVNFSDPNLLKIKNKLGDMSSSQQKKVVAKGLGGSIPSTLGPLDQKQLALYFLMSKSQSKVQRKFVEVTNKLFLRDGKVDLLGFNANFYKIPATLDNLSDEELELYTGIIELAAAKRAVSPNLSIKTAFYDSLDDIINDKNLPSESKIALRDAKAKMQEKNCFFK